MRVLQILPSIGSETGGPVRSTLANCHALHGVDPDVRFTLASTDVGLEAGWRETLEARFPPGMDMKVFPGFGRHAFMVSPRLTAWLWRHVEAYDLVVVRALLHPVSSSAGWIARRRGVPYLVVPHGTLSRYTFSHRRTLLKRVYFRLVERHTLAGAAGVRFTSDVERREAPRWDGGTPVRVIPHSYEPRGQDAHTEKSKRQQILFLSRLDVVKGIDTLLNAFQLVLAEIPAARLVLAGSGTASYERRVRSKVHGLDLTDAVDLPGFVEGGMKSRLLTESTVFVLPSRKENFGVAVVEAMDAGLPVVISREVGIWPHVEEAGAGIVIEDRSPEAVAEALVRLLCDREMREEMGRNGRELVRNAFAPTTVGRQLRDLYRTVARGRGPSVQALT
jgi:glycosyltransferase involved in cell wall biosynthesis